MDQPDVDRVHREAIVIDGTCPLLNDEAYASWWIEGGATAAAPTVGAFEGAGGTLKNLARWRRIIEHDERLMLVRSAADIEQAKADGRFGIIFHFQSTTPIEDDLNLVSVFKDLGVGMIQLTYNTKNRVGDGAEERTNAGLSHFGVKLIERLNEARVIVDCSHTGEQTTLEAIELSSAPVVFSHANVKALRPSPRTITDRQIRAAAESGGLVGIVGYPAFVSDSPRPTLDEFIAHIDHIVNVGGIDHVGLGIDYYQGQAGVADLKTAAAMYRNALASGRWTPESYPPPPYHYPAGIETPRTLSNLTRRLLERGYSEADTKKIIGGNWLRVFREVWGC
ncbi:MAG: dipeptidase [Thermomicrobiales bacterium]